MSELEQGVWHPNADDLGIDARMIREIGELLINEEQPIESLDARSNGVTFSEWTEADGTAYARFIDEVTSRAGHDKAPRAEQFGRASTLGIGPGRIALQSILGVQKFSQIQSMLGYDTHGEFIEWDRNRLITEGSQLAHALNRRPTRGDVASAHEERSFVSTSRIHSEFETFQQWHEHIGYPSVKGWEKDDFIDWGVALLRANPDLRITVSILSHFSGRGRGPSFVAVTDAIGGVPRFRDLVEHEFARQRSEEEKSTENLYRMLETDIEEGEIIIDRELLSEAMSSSEFPAHYARFKLHKHLAPLGDDDEMFARAQRMSSDKLRAYIAKNSDEVFSEGAVEVVASDVGLFDHMWPMHRFQNVDFSVPQEIYNPPIGKPSHKKAA